MVAAVFAASSTSSCATSSEVDEDTLACGVEDLRLRRAQIEAWLKVVELQRAIALAYTWSSGSQSCTQIEVDQHHAVEIQQAVEAAAAWREATFGTTPLASGVPSGAQFAPAREEAQSVEEARQHPWGPQFQTDVAAEQSATADSPHQPTLEGGAKCAKLLRVALTNEHSSYSGGGSTTSGPDGTASAISSTSSSAQDRPEIRASMCWVHGARLSDVSQILVHGISAAPGKVSSRCLKHHNKSRRGARLFSGPWSRTGVGCVGAEVLVFVDVAGARRAGAEFLYCKNGLRLSPGGSSIPPTCLWRMVRITDGKFLYDLSAHFISDVDSAVEGETASAAQQHEQPKPSPCGRSSPLAAWLHSMDPPQQARDTTVQLCSDAPFVKSNASFLTSGLCSMDAKQLTASPCTGSPLADWLRSMDT